MGILYKHLFYSVETSELHCPTHRPRPNYSVSTYHSFFCEQQKIKHEVQRCCLAVTSLVLALASVKDVSAQLQDEAEKEAVRAYLRGYITRREKIAIRNRGDGLPWSFWRRNPTLKGNPYIPSMDDLPVELEVYTVGVDPLDV